MNYYVAGCSTTIIACCACPDEQGGTRGHSLHRRVMLFGKGRLNELLVSFTLINLKIICLSSSKGSPYGAKPKLPGVFLQTGSRYAADFPAGNE